MLNNMVQEVALERNRNIYALPEFIPTLIDQRYLKNLGVASNFSNECLSGLRRGSEYLIKRIKCKMLPPPQVLELARTDMDTQLDVHNYTNNCPALTYEINPVQGCGIGCAYCLVNDGEHQDRLKVFKQYPVLIEKILNKNYENNTFFYFSPKTEAFQEATLTTGIAHDILRAFIKHFEKHPDSKARLFIASKAGRRQLGAKHRLESILELLSKLKGKVQFNTSLAMMPEHLRRLLEPYSALLDDRLDAVKLCQDSQIQANSALIQPIIIPYLTITIIKQFIQKLKAANIINFKPEFLTLCMENLALIGQLTGYFSKTMERELYDCYIAKDNSDHKKQRERTAPNRSLSLNYIELMQKIGRQHGLSISICYWVRKELKITEGQIPTINANGFQCLGYQTKLFK